MTGPVPGEETYAGPPPTRRPEGTPWYPPAGHPAPWYPPPGYPPPQAWGAPPWGQPTWAPAPYAPAPYGAVPYPPAPYGPGPVAWYPPPWGPPPPGMHWKPPPGTPPHDVPQPFLLAMRTRSWGWWRPAVGLLLILVVYLVAALITFVIGGVGLFIADGAAFLEMDPAAMYGPGFILVLNLVTAVAIPVVWLAWAATHGMRIGWSSSVLGRLRWRLLPSFVGLALLTIGVSIVASFGLSLAFSDAAEEEITGPVASYGWLLVVVLLTTPLQSAAEEYLFRGYLSQAVAGWIRDPRAGGILAALVSAVLFSLAHLPPGLSSFGFYFFFGLAASAVVWLTGGLEAAIALHSVNNVVIFVLAGALGEDVLSASESSAGVPWFDVLLALLALTAFVALVARSRRRLQPELQTAAQDLRLPFLADPVPAR